MSIWILTDRLHYQSGIEGVRYFRRRIYEDLLEWKNKWAGRYALSIEGARRVGKSTIVEEMTWLL